MVHPVATFSVAGVPSVGCTVFPYISRSPSPPSGFSNRRRPKPLHLHAPQGRGMAWNVSWSSYNFHVLHLHSTVVSVVATNGGTATRSTDHQIFGAYSRNRHYPTLSGVGVALPVLPCCRRHDIQPPSTSPGLLPSKSQPNFVTLPYILSSHHALIIATPILLSIGYFIITWLFYFSLG